MNRRLVLIHGRSQEHKSAEKLKRSWVAALKRGLAKSNLELPIPEREVRFPYYGDALHDLASGKEDGVAKVITKGATRDHEFSGFAKEILLEVCAKAGITDADIEAAMTGEKVIEMGILNWKWVRAILRTIDRLVPLASAASIALFTNDVYKYLRNPGILNQIEMRVRAAFEPGIPTIVVAHSLGSVVAYNLLRTEGTSLAWRIPVFVTVGAPLAVSRIKALLAPNHHPECIDKWFNALDAQDVVALHPLTKRHFPIDPEIENKTDVQNPSPNHHGIEGYLADRDVAKKIHDALIASAVPRE
ncbi:MAG: hypothetical protein AAB074_04410 [Planctomycetota bacterium]